MLIAISGTDGAGKTTQINIVMKAFTEAGLKPKYIWARGGYTPLILKVKAFALKFFGRRGNTRGFDIENSQKYVERRTRMMRRPMIAKLWLTLAILDLILLYGFYLRVMVLCGRIVVCDRYIGDTKIDFERNFPDSFKESGLLWRLLKWSAPRPNISFLLIVPVELSQQRSQLKNEPFPDDAETLTFRFLKYSNCPDFKRCDIVRIDGSGSVESVTNKILSEINNLVTINIRQ